MLAAEHILIDITIISYIPKLRDQLYEHNRALEYTLSFLSLPSDNPRGRRITEYQHSRKPWTLAEILKSLIMTTRLVLLTLSIQIFALTVFGQKPTCKSLHTGSFKVFTKESGTTFIKRTEKLQTEKNDDLGYEIIFDVVWINECTYELRPKKLIKGDPSIMGDGTYVLKTRIKEISNNTYIAESSANFNPGVADFVVEILK